MVYPGILADGSLLPGLTASDVRGTIGVGGFLSVKDYGATGDGVTSDQTAVRNAMDAAITADVPLYVPPGTYNVGLFNYDPATDGELFMFGDDAETTIMLGDISSNGFLDVPAEFTGKLRFHGIHFKNFFRCFDFSENWLAGTASTIQEFSMHRCKATQVATTGVRSIVFIPSPLKRSHVIEKCHITDSYFEFGSADASAHIIQLSGAAINDLKVDGNEFVNGQRQVNWMPSLSAGERDDVAKYLPSPKITNNLFRDVSATVTNTSFIRIAGLNVDISRNTFRNFLSNEVASCGAVYAQAVGEISFNSFEDVHGSLGAVYSKGTPKYSPAKISTVARSSNVATVVSIKDHGLVNDDVVDVVGCLTAGFNSTGNTVTVTDSRTFTFANTGGDVTATDEPLGYAYDGEDRSGYDLDVSWNRFTHTREPELSSGIFLARGSHAIRFNTFDGWYSNGNDACIRIDSDGDMDGVMIEGNRFRGCNSAQYINVLSAVTESLEVKSNFVSDTFNGGTFCRIVGVGTYDGFVLEANTIIQNNPNNYVVSFLDVVPLSSGTVVLNHPRLVGNQFTGDNTADCRMFIFRTRTDLVDPVITGNWGPDSAANFLVESGTVNWSGVEIVQDNYADRTYTVATVPDATRKGQTIFVTDGAAGSPILAYADGTDWLRLDTATAVAAS